MSLFGDYFTKSHFGYMKSYLDKKKLIENERNEQIKMAFFLSSMFIFLLMLALVLLGFMAVPKICPDPSERGKNTRLGLYALLLLSGGQIGWLYILLWIAKINLCL